MPLISAIIPAAGKSSRMQGKDKLLESIDGIPLLRRAMLAARNSNLHETIVVTRPRHYNRRLALSDLNPVHAISTHPENTFSRSILAGMTRVNRKADGIMIFLPDMPGIGQRELNLLIKEFDSTKIVRACTDDGIAGSPVLFPRIHFGILKSARGDSGVGKYLRTECQNLVPVSLGGKSAIIDLDDADSWNRWLSERHSP